MTTTWLRYWREGAILVLGVAVVLLWHRGQRLDQRRDAAVHATDSAWLAVRYYRQRDGQRTAQVNTLELTVGDLKQLGERLGTDNASLKQQVGALTNLVGYWRGQAGFRGRDTVSVHDTVYVDKAGHPEEVPTAFWTNQHLYLRTQYLPATRQFVHDYSYDLGGFEVTAYRKPTGLLGLGRGQLVSDVTFGDPNLQVRRFEGVVVKQAPPRWFETRGFAVGVGVAAGILLGTRATRP